MHSSFQLENNFNIFLLFSHFFPFVFLTAKPGPPVNPEAVDKTKNSVDLSWQPPRRDGNSKIIGYLIEYQKVGDEEWKKANLTADSCPETKYKVTGLTEGLTYKFRVRAVNAAGESEPAYVPDPVEVKDRLGEFNKIR